MSDDPFYRGKPTGLRDPERVAMLEVDHVVDLCLEGLDAARVLDVGTGSALFAEAFAARGLAVAGVDILPEMVEAARQFVPEGDFRLGPAEALPFPDDSCDLVFMSGVLHEAEDAV